MNKKMSLLTGAAAGVFLAAGVTAQAQAKPAHHKVHQPSAAEQLAAKQAAMIEQLQAKVDSLSERLLATEQQQAQVSQQAAQAQATAQAAQAQAAQAQAANEIITLPG